MTFMSQVAKTFGASALMALLLVGTNSYAQPLTDAQIRSAIIQRSIASYPSDVSDAAVAAFRRGR